MRTKKRAGAKPVVKKPTKKYTEASRARRFLVAGGKRRKTHKRTQRR